MFTSVLQETKSEVKSEEGDDEDEGEGDDEEGEGEGRRLVCHWKCSNHFSCKKMRLWYMYMIE